MQDKINVLINSGGLDVSLKLYDKEGKKYKIACNPVHANRVTAYDSICVISDPGKYNLKKSKILRRRLNNYLPSVKLPISLNF